MKTNLYTAVLAALGATALSGVTTPACATGINKTDVPVNDPAGQAGETPPYVWDGGNIGFGAAGTPEGSVKGYAPVPANHARVGGANAMSGTAVENIDSDKNLGWNHTMTWRAFEIKTAGGYTVAVDRTTAGTDLQPAFSLFSSGSARWDAAGSSHSFNQVQGPGTGPGQSVLNKVGNATSPPYMITGGADITGFVGYANSGAGYTNGEGAVVLGALAFGSSTEGPLQDPSLPYGAPLSNNAPNYYTSVVVKGDYTNPHAGAISAAYAGAGSSVNTSNPGLANENGGGHADVQLWLTPGWYVIGAGGSCADFTCTASAAAKGAIRVTVLPNPNVMAPVTMDGPRRDFDGDGKADLFWRQGQSGLNTLWFMHGALRKGNVVVAQQPKAWSIAGVNDFNNDGKADILWRDPAAGKNLVWLMGGGTVASDADLPDQSNSEIAGTGDFDGDGKPDILWFNAANGETSLWLLDGTSLKSGIPLPTGASGQAIAETGDFNGDNKADIFWRDSVSGKNSLWLVDGTANPTAADVPTQKAAWSAAGAGDFDGDDKCDLLWRNATTGQNQLWLMNGGTRKSIVKLPRFAKTWSVSGVDDFDGDGKLDIFWRNENSGQNNLWLMDGTTRKTKAVVRKIAQIWKTPSR